MSSWQKQTKIIQMSRIDRLPSISVIVSTRDRPRDLTELMMTILNQDLTPREVIVVDGSSSHSAREVVDSFRSQLKFKGCQLRYVGAGGTGLTYARNLGVGVARSDAILFVDDDIEMARNVISELAIFLRDHPIALGVQPEVLSSNNENVGLGLSRSLETAIFKALMLTYREDNKMAVRRSGWSIVPNYLTRTIMAQRLQGCCCCYRRSLFDDLWFDTNLKRWGYLEDLDFSYRVYKGNPYSLYAIPKTRVIHKITQETRLTMSQSILMMTVYSFYIFFKDVFRGSTLNLASFLYALMSQSVMVVAGCVLKRKPKREWWAAVFLIYAYVKSLKNLRLILMRNLGFFNATVDS